MVAIKRKKGQLPPIQSPAATCAQIEQKLRAEIRAWKEQKGREKQALREIVFAEMRMLGLR